MNINTSAYVVSRLINDVRQQHQRMEAQTLDALAVVAKNPGIAIIDLADRIGVSEAAASRTVSKLGPGSPKKLGLGLIYRYESPENRRFKQVELTDRGRQFFSNIGDTLKDALKQAKVTD
ncbi:DNA-binding MarR family transcriptional regulator [Tamilnaduibacter salinus]|uniref:DNA-binding MarR family transcriptional regulator n=1 Tax=Tamilnaduibacter salinus TaxID=1484056 RepID=A0A2A2HZM0_9GAMM|nr:MarR family transcriptional regulator [Tamilnaduibacter salinus]PAV24486.1 hypothetical protein CF392_16005 [Tamilnaduibacter salinus]PVY79190.1 DNA-binding MarR family transcriptional regulator [Tamilnaduibacter salinus]